MLRHIPWLHGADVLDLGCGPLALHGAFAAQHGARQTLSVDIDASALDEAASSTTSVAALGICKSDLLAAVHTQQFDAVLFHPPMLPELVAPATDERLTYHLGGPLGRDVLDRGLQESSVALRSGGVLVLGQFEFLGVDRSFGAVTTTQELLERLGLSIVDIVHYPVAMTSLLASTVARLAHLFPKYMFVRSRGATYHRFSVVTARKCDLPSEKTTGTGIAGHTSSEP